MAKVTMKNNINIPSQLKKIDNDAFWKYSATQWWRLYYKFIPFRTGALADTVKFAPKQIEHIVPYANKMYNGNFNWRTNKHAMATGKWDKAAISSKKDEILIQQMQAYVDTGRLKLD